jgi:outer membrane lipoprotein
MKHWFRLVLFFLVFLLSGCAHVISKDLRAKSDPYLTLSQVRQNPDGFKGKMVIWGGEIVETVNLKGAATQIEVFQRPLGWRGEPKGIVSSEGRFLIFADQYLDPYLYRAGRKITVMGEILGEKIKPLGEMDYRYPLLSGRQIHLWPEYAYHPYPYPYPYYYYDPWWYYGPRWYWGIGFHYHHRRR